MIQFYIWYKTKDFLKDTVRIDCDYLDALNLFQEKIGKDFAKIIEVEIHAGCDYVSQSVDLEFAIMDKVREEKSKMKIETDEFSPNALPYVEASTMMDVFENAIRSYGVGNFAEYVGYEYRGEFAVDQLEHLKTQYRSKEK